MAFGKILSAVVINVNEDLRSCVLECADLWALSDLADRNNPLMQVATGLPREQGDGVAEDGRDHGEALAHGFG